MIDDNETDERLVNYNVIDNIESNDISLRPRRISEFIGQSQVQKNLLTFITAAETTINAALKSPLCVRCFLVGLSSCSVSKIDFPPLSNALPIANPIIAPIGPPPKIQPKLAPNIFPNIF